MREYISVLRDGIKLGLRRNSRATRNEERLITCYNLRVGEHGLEPYEALEDVFGETVETVWPLPQVIRTLLGLYLMSYDTLYKVNESDFTLENVLTSIESSDQWHVADFGEYQVWTDGTTILAREYNEDTKVFGWSAKSVNYTINSVCNFRGQLLAGGVNDTGIDENVVFYSRIGHADLSTLFNGYGEDISGGFVPMPWEGTIYCVKPLGNGVMVYGDKGIALLKPGFVEPIPAFGVNKLFDFGIVSRSAVGGDEDVHIFVDTSNRVWRIDANYKLMMLDYSEYIEEVADDIVIARNPLNGDFYISNGADASYLLTPIGMSSIHQALTSICAIGDTAIAPLVSIGSTDVVIVTDKLDFMNRGIKTITGLELGLASNNAATVTASVEYAYSISGSFTRSASKPVNGSGFVAPIVSGTDFRIVVLSTSNTDFYLDYINVKWKQSDKRYIRGVYEVQTNKTVS